MILLDRDNLEFHDGRRGRNVRPLAQSELLLLEALGRLPNSSLTAFQLLSQTGIRSAASLARRICLLRKKIGKNRVKTVGGKAGYYVSEPVKFL